MKRQTGAFHGTYCGIPQYVHTVSYPAAGEDAVRNLAMHRMLFYPPNSSKAFIPAAFISSVPPATKFSMTNCTITTLCVTLSAYRHALMDNSSPAGTRTVSTSRGHHVPASDNGRSLHACMHVKCAPQHCVHEQNNAPAVCPCVQSLLYSTPGVANSL